MTWRGSLTSVQNESDDSNIGSADTTATSASSVLSTLAPVAIYALIFGALFVVFRRWFPRIYRPRTFLGSLRADRRTPQISETLFGGSQRQQPGRSLR